jgi:hypothetical protein
VRPGGFVAKFDWKGQIVYTTYMPAAISSMTDAGAEKCTSEPRRPDRLLPASGRSGLYHRWNAGLPWPLCASEGWQAPR